MKYLITPVTKPVEVFAYWEKGFNQDELNWLRQKAAASSKESYVGGGIVNYDVRRSKVNWLSFEPENEWVYKRLDRIVGSLNANYFNYDIVGFGENVQLTNYDSSIEGFYDWHKDNGGEGTSRKLSVVVQLTDPGDYEGGHLEIMNVPNNIIKIRKEQGLVTVFPSNTIHRVTPVTQGSRQSLVCWVSGPPFK
jgi:PKHD-type hydroxylase